MLVDFQLGPLQRPPETVNSDLQLRPPSLENMSKSEFENPAQCTRSKTLKDLFASPSSK